MKPQEQKDRFIMLRAEGKGNLLKACEQTELQAKTDALETIVGGLG